MRDISALRLFAERLSTMVMEKCAAVTGTACMHYHPCIDRRKTFA